MCLPYNFAASFTSIYMSYYYAELTRLPLKSTTCSTVQHRLEQQNAGMLLTTFFWHSIKHCSLE